MRLRKDQRLGWWLCDETKTLSYKDGRKVRLGKRLEMKTRAERNWNSYFDWNGYDDPDLINKPVCCYQGMHASETIAQALEYCPGPILCRVLVEGDIDTQHDKFAGRYRTVLWWKKIPEDFYSWSEARQNAWARENGAPHVPKTKRRKARKKRG